MQRLRAKVIVTVDDVEERLDLQALQRDLGCEVVYIRGRTSGPAGLFDTTILGDDIVIPSSPSRPHRLEDQSLVLHTSGTSGRKKVVPYNLRSLIVGTWAVVHSWELKPSDVNRALASCFVMNAHLLSSQHDAVVPCWWYRSQLIGTCLLWRELYHVYRI